MRCFEANSSSLDRRLKNSSVPCLVTLGRDSLSASPREQTLSSHFSWAVGIGSEHAVITTAYSFFGTAGSIARVGATPIFVDIDPATFNLSADALQHFLQHRCEHTSTAPIYRGKRIRAVVPVHLFGLCCEMDPIRTLADRFRLSILEDALKQSAQNTPLRPARDRPVR